MTNMAMFQVSFHNSDTPLKRCRAEETSRMELINKGNADCVARVTVEINGNQTAPWS